MFKFVARFILSIVIILSLSSYNLATADSSITGGMGYFMSGVGMIDIGSLNKSLEGNGYAGFSNRYVSFGGGGHAVIKGLLIGGEGHGIILNDVSAGLFRESLGASYGLFNLGYLIYSNDTFNFYPIVGIGGGGISLEIKDTRVSSFEGLLKEPRRMVVISRSLYLIDVSLGLDTLIGSATEGKSIGGFLLGVRAGYTFSPIKRDWTMDNVELSGGPNVGIEGFYIRVLIGGGGVSRQ